MIYLGNWFARNYFFFFFWWWWWEWWGVGVQEYYLLFTFPLSLPSTQLFPCAQPYTWGGDGIGSLPSQETQFIHQKQIIESTVSRKVCNNSKGPDKFVGKAFHSFHGLFLLAIPVSSFCECGIVGFLFFTPLLSLWHASPDCTWLLCLGPLHMI